MDDKLRAIRRRRRRERRRLRRLWNLAPLVLVGLAYLLSAGVVKLMEVPPAKDEASSVAKGDAATQQLPRLLSAPDTRPELPVMLSTSILDHELDGPPEDALERARRDARPADSDVPTIELDGDDEDNDWSRVPEAGSGLLGRA